MFHVEHFPIFNYQDTICAYAMHMTEPGENPDYFVAPLALSYDTIITD